MSDIFHLYDNAFQYLWIDHSGYAEAHVVLTLGPIESVVVLALLGAAIAAAQRSWWTINRWILVRVVSPIRLADDQDPLPHLSQSQAIRALAAWWKRRRGGTATTTTTSTTTMAHVSPWFGACSLFTIAIFLFLGAFIPYYLTGASATPTVQTRSSAACDGLHSYSATARKLADEYYEKCSGKKSRRLSEDCDYQSQMIDTFLKVYHLSEKGPCPFGEPADQVCVPAKDDGRGDDTNLTQVLTLEQNSFDPTSYGLNVAGGVKQSHRLTCALLNVQQSAVREKPAYGYLIGYPRAAPGPDDDANTEFWRARDYAEPLDLVRVETGNPKRLEREKPHGLYQGGVHILKLIPDAPRFWELFQAPDPDVWKDSYRRVEVYHPSLRQQDGDGGADTFVVLNWYLHPSRWARNGPNGLYIFDPHSIPKDFDPKLLASPLSKESDVLRRVRETLPYTIGCREQYRLCHGGGDNEACTAWSGARRATDELARLLAGRQVEALQAQKLLLEAASARRFLLAHFLGKPAQEEWWPRVGNNGLALVSGWSWELLGKRGLVEDREDENSRSRYWRVEVFRWFELAWLMTKAAMLTSAEGGGDDGGAHAAVDDSGWICDRVLYRDTQANYTNIDAVGLAATVVSLLVVWAITRAGTAKVRLAAIGGKLQAVWSVVSALATGSGSWATTWLKNWASTIVTMMMMTAAAAGTSRSWWRRPFMAAPRLGRQAGDAGYSDELPSAALSLEDLAS